jgi:hypothetical protein
MDVLNPFQHPFWDTYLGQKQIYFSNLKPFWAPYHLHVLTIINWFWTSLICLELPQFSTLKTPKFLDIYKNFMNIKHNLGKQRHKSCCISNDKKILVISSRGFQQDPWLRWLWVSSAWYSIGLNMTWALLGNPSVTPIYRFIDNYI